MKNKVFDSLSKEGILSSLDTDFFANEIYIYDEINSTNTIAKSKLHLPEGSLFVADRQTAGRGRLGREWSSEKGTGIFMSLLLKPQMSAENVSQITLALGLGVCRALSEHCNVKAKIKWPNDIVIGTKKVCGVLTELVTSPDSTLYAIAGIGVNVHNKSFDNELWEKATSLYLETHQNFQRSKVIAQILNYIEKYYKMLITEGFSAFREEYKKNCVNIGREVLIIENGHSQKVNCIDISDKGELTVQDSENTRAVHSGEVSVRGLYGYI